MNKTQQQVIALAGLFQSMHAVEDIAQKGLTDNSLVETALNSLFIINPESTIEVYGDISKIKGGLNQITTLLGQNSTNKQMNAVRYALAIIHLEKKLSKQSDMLATLSKRLERTQNQVQHFGLLHENVISSIAEIYSDTISTFKLRVQISGQERFLTIDHNAAKIRCLLLSGIRAAMLWRQLGGHRWHFIFKRGSIAEQSKYLLKS